jgi:hypothetical protein
VQHLSRQGRVVDHGSTRMVREDALFVPVLTPREHRHRALRQSLHAIRSGTSGAAPTGDPVSGRQGQIYSGETIPPDLLRHMDPGSFSISLPMDCSLQPLIRDVR